MAGDKLYNGHDELTGLQDSVYFFPEYERRKAELRRYGKTNGLAVLSLPGNTPIEWVKEIARFWEQSFEGVCRCKEKPGYVLMGLHEDVGDSVTNEISGVLNEKYPGINVRIVNITIDGNSGSLDEITERFFAKQE